MSPYDDRSTPPDFLVPSAGYDPASEEFAELRELLLSGERRRLEELERRLDALGLTPEGLAEFLPEAIALRAGRDKQLARALTPTVESSLRESVRRNPREIAAAIFPVLGPAIRKAIAETLAGLVQSINRALEHSLSPRGLKWRIEAWRTGVPYAQIVLRHALVYRVEQVFLIHAETGLLLGHVAPPELKVADADLISAMLTAIQDFVGDSFAEQDSGGLRTFSVGELTIMVERGPQAVIAAVIRGTPPDTLLRKLQDTLETIHLHFAGAFADFVGDAAPFQPAHPILEECLETVLSTDREAAARAPTAWLRWALPLLLLVTVAAALLWRSQRRWTQSVARLQAEPGIEVTEASRAWGTWHIRGLRDPLAADPATLLASLGADSSSLNLRFESYLSLEPMLILARVRRTLAAPPSVTLTLQQDSVLAAGTAPLAWVARSLRPAPLPPGVSHLDLSGVTAELSLALAALRDDTERRLVLFQVGSADVSPAARAELEAALGSFRRLKAGALEESYRVSLELTGRTDPTGTDAANQALSRWRVDAVRQVLVAAGLSTLELDGTGIGTTSPLPARGGVDPAAINRSVSFQVRLSPLTVREGAR